MGSKLTFEDSISIEGIASHEWIPLLHGYGPYGKCTCKVSVIVNLINLGIKVLLSDENAAKLYTLVKGYNSYIDTIQSDKPKVELAEQELYKMVYNKEIQIQREDDKVNPFVQTESGIRSDEDFINQMTQPQINAGTITQGSNKVVDPFKLSKKNKDQKLKRPKAYELFKDINTEKSISEQNDELLSMYKFGGIEFQSDE